MKVHLLNAGKYFAVILVHFANIFRIKMKSDTTLFIYLSVYIVSTIYSYSWDLYMDWGLLRAPWNDSKRFLRPKTLFPLWFYYYAIVSNLLLRFCWMIPFLPLLFTVPQWLLTTQTLIIIVTLSEGFRRA